MQDKIKEIEPENPYQQESVKQHTLDMHDNTQYAINYHKKWINFIKKSLGKECSFVSYVKEKDNYFIKAIINKKPIYAALGGDPADVNNDSYSSLLQQLKDHAKNNK